ncbi:MAG: hypothetical protein ACM3PT_05760 [Deltaproteobacteria bacterium]
MTKSLNPRIKCFFLGFLFFSSAISVKSQIGIDIIGNQQSYINWNDVMSDYTDKEFYFLRYSYGGGINYWFRLKNYRIEFTPGLYYLYSDTKYKKSDIQSGYHSHTTGLEFDVNIYPFEIRKKSYEKDCPSFSTRGDYFPKSFFLQVSPGFNGSYRYIETIRYFDTGWKIDFGCGLDMKLTERIIMAPIIKYGFSFSNDWKGFAEYHGEESYNNSTQGNYISLVLSFYIK